MSLAEIVPIALQLSLALGVFATALESTKGTLPFLFRRPGLLARSLIAMFVVMPVFALAIAGAFDLLRGLEIALFALALSPVPPILPAKQIKAGGEASYALALLMVSALVSIVVVPTAVHLVGWGLGRPLEVPLGPLVKIALTSLVVPLLLGVAVRIGAPAFAKRFSRKLAMAANVLLALAVLPVLIGSWHNIVALVGNFTLLAIAAFVVVGLAVGHLLGGPDEEDRTVLALATATRHPAIAIAIGHAIAPGQKTVAAAALLFLLAATALSVPYVKWRIGRSAAVARPTS